MFPNPAPRAALSLPARAWVHGAVLRAPVQWDTVLLLAGVVLRLRQFVFNRSLWLDEAYLAASFVDKAWSQLLLEPLSNNQAAPLSFVAIAKALAMVFGMHDWVLRLPALVAGLLTLGVSWALARRLFEAPAARATLVGLVALSPVLVYYSSEFKQYALDVLAVASILWLAVRTDLAHSPRGLWALALAGALAIWFSHASLFVLAGAGTVLWIEALTRRRRVAWLAVSAMGVLWVISFAANHALSLRALTGNQHLVGFWIFAYAPLPPASLADGHWYLNSALGLVHLSLRHVGVAHHGEVPGWFDPLNHVLLALCLLGSFALARRSPRVGAIGLVTLLSVLVASSMQLYPFRSRLILFLVPLTHLGLASLVQTVRDTRCLPWPRTASWSLATLLLLLPATLSTQVLLTPHNEQDIKGALDQVRGLRQPGDGFLIDTLTHKAFSFYAPERGLADAPLLLFRPTKNQAHDALSSVRRLCTQQPMQRSWVIVTHRHRDRGPYLDHLSSVAAPIHQWENQGAAVRLYDFQTSAHCRRYSKPS